MKADVTISKLYWDVEFAKYFFRRQAYQTFTDLVKRIGRGDAGLETLSNAIENNYLDLDSFEEDCYNLDVDQMLEILGLDF